VRERAAEFHAASLAYPGSELVVYPDGLAMAADWQKELRASRESYPPEQIQEAVRKHGLKRARPDMHIPPDLREPQRGIGVFLNPEESKEIMCGFGALVAGLKRRGHVQTGDEEDAIQVFIHSDSISPAFVRRALAEHGAEFVQAAFRLPEPVPVY
jgi:hypothetical protein